MKRFLVGLLLTPSLAFASGWIHVDPKMNGDEAFQACKDASQHKDSEGRKHLIWPLVESCMEAQGFRREKAKPIPKSRGGELFLKRSDGELVAMHKVAMDAWVCRYDAVGIDASGRPRIDQRKVRSCMAERGYERAAKVLRQEKKARKSGQLATPAAEGG